MPLRDLPRPYEAVLFDVDGTLVDSVPVIVRGLEDTFERFAARRPAQDEIRSKIGIPLARQLGMYSVMSPTPDEIARMTEYAISSFERHQALESRFDAAVEALRLAHARGLGTALVTSKGRVELDLFLRRFDAADAVHAVVCADDVRFPKPDPESARLACARLGVPPDRAVMIGDSVYDLRCAREAGLTTVAVAYGAGDEAALRAERPDFFVPTPESLLDWATHHFLPLACPVSL